MVVRLFVVCCLAMGSHLLYAQNFRVEYTTEWQTNFSNCNFVNLLSLGAEVPLGKRFSWDVSTISVAKTREASIVDDLQTFSNIEEDNLLLALSVCGVTWNVNDHHSLSFGVRNMNEDYFATPVTSFFTNSSCGVFPTISANYSIANYPLASMGLHYSYSIDKLLLQASLYNGKGYKRFIGHESCFRIRPDEDGVFMLSEAQLLVRDSRYIIGNALLCSKGVSAVPWVYVEQQITDKIAMIVGYSHAFVAGGECRDFAGLGGYYQKGKVEFGMYTDVAWFPEEKEWATELTGKFALNQYFSVQPILHFILTGDRFDTVCSIRLELGLLK